MKEGTAMEIPMFRPQISESAVRRVSAVLRSGRIGEGENVRLFEDEFCQYTNAGFSVAVNSGTAALHLALLRGGVRPGDEVITSAQTFIATGQAILATGARVVFADLAVGSANLDPRDVRKRVTEHTKAIIPVHYGGYPCDMTEICDIARKYGITVVEDAAHALGADYKGDPVGGLSDYTCFSFQAIKHITTGDGGMLTVKTSDDRDVARRMRWFGLDRKTPAAGSGLLDVTTCGFKYHMNDIAAALGRVQLQEFPPRLARRQSINRIYREQMRKIPGVTLLAEARDRTNACWLFTILVEHRERFVRALQGQGIEAGVWHPRIDRFTIFGGFREDLTNQAYFSDHQVSLPLRDNLTDEEIASVIKAVTDGW